MMRSVQRTAPFMNHRVVFSTASDSSHAHPEPLACPSGRAHRSLAPRCESRPDAAKGLAEHATLRQVPPDAARRGAVDRYAAAAMGCAGRVWREVRDVSRKP